MLKYSIAIAALLAASPLAVAEQMMDRGDKGAGPSSNSVPEHAPGKMKDRAAQPKTSHRVNGRKKEALRRSSRPDISKTIPPLALMRRAGWSANPKTRKD